MTRNRDDQFADYRYHIGDEVSVPPHGRVGRVIQRQPAWVYRVELPGVPGPLFYSEAQLRQAESAGHVVPSCSLN